MLVPDVVEWNAEKVPNREAIVFEDGARLTWSQFNRLAERVADLLASCDVRPGDRVAVISRNAAESFALYVGTNKIGAIYVPLNYRFAVREFRDVLHDCDPRVIFVHAEFDSLVGRLREAGDGAQAGHRRWITFGDVPGRFTPFPDLGAAGQPPRRPRYSGAPDDISCICYTGGTTGVSKGVMLSHRNVLSTAHNIALTSRVREDDTYLVAGPLFHVALVVPIGYWLAGARTVVMNFEAPRALDLMSQERVTQLVATGTIFKMLVDEMQRHPRRLMLRNIDFGGAPISVQLARRARELLGCTVAQIYGQTETALMTTYLYPEEYERGWQADAGDPLGDRLRSVGRAAPTLLVRVVDKQLRPVPPGSVGEVVVRGDSVTAGYWNKPDLTAEVLGDGWLRTGDLGRMDSDGYVYLVDRLNDVIITGGENVYSSEVELVLAEHPDVAEAVVVGRPDEHWGERVCAILVPAPGRRPSLDEIQVFCRQRLAAYKIPRSIDVRAELPRLPTGKIAKGALRADA